MPNTILVTGATGFLGRHLVNALLRENDTNIRALVRTLPAGLPSTVDLLQADVTRDDGAVERAMSGCDVVFHCAGAVGDRVTWANGRAVNVEGTRLVARAARNESVKRFVHVSSVAVYGFDGGVYDESCPRARVTEPYITTKSEGELACQAELDGSETKLVILRPAIIYGPGDTGMIPRMVELLRKRVPMIGDGSAGVGLVHVQDVVAAMLAAVRYDGVKRIFNVAGPDDISWAELVAQLTTVFGLPEPRRMPRTIAMVLARVMRLLSMVRVLPNPPLTTFAVKFLTEARRYSTSALREELGVTPAIQALHGLAGSFGAVKAPTLTPMLAAP